MAQSIELGKPIVLVTIHYRLNIFGFGDQEGELNLGLQDQRVSIEWVKRYIKDFGGDPVSPHDEGFLHRQTDSTK